ncbi:alkaline phosphatase [Rhodovulum strictum]|uniref:Alkaline phosphatase n=1 Tax=Rhodovulum strictum TaxID=58314 RepID=A0A844BSI6_9RHOB|nr:alkaline phosphatase [Rhodovulum strictum]MRH22897.1 alkaline phosphatase [Rhodovulum strictum]
MPPAIDLDPLCHPANPAVGTRRLGAALRRFQFLCLSAMAAALATVAPAEEAASGAPVSVILFISDGASYETWNMAGYWARGERDGAPWSDWPVRLGMTTFPLNTATMPTMDDVARKGYDPALAWSAEAVAPDETIFAPVFPGAPAMVYPSPVAGYRWVRQGFTDSAAGGTALATGVKTFNNAIAVDNFGLPLAIVTEDAKRAGLSTGVVTSVPFNHATPAAFGANSLIRDDNHGIAHQMIFGYRLDVIAGAGNPAFDESGRRREMLDFTWVSAEDWTTLLTGAAPRALFQSAEEVAALAEGTLAAPERWIAVPEVGATLQMLRDPMVVGEDAANPSGAAFIPGLPDLATLTRAALNSVGQNPEGFFLMVEGGAVDWAAHLNATGLLIEEQLDFEAAVAATLDWLDAEGRLDSTLLIVATDHGNGLPLGPDSDSVPWQPVPNQGPGVLPELRWHANDHTNEVTRLWATGPGAECLTGLVTGVDPGLRDIVGHNDDGRFIDNTAIAPVIRAAIAGSPCPEPGE